MEIILKKDVKNLGYKDDLLKVKDGYALNFLIPQGMAVVASTSAKKMLDETKKQRAHKEEKIKTEATKTAEALKGLTVRVGAKAGESGKIFGSVTPLQIAEAIKKLGFDVDRKNITIQGDSIKSLGKYMSEIRLHKDIVVNVQFEVVED
jgi:large subunit ribosomal protein L9